MVKKRLILVLASFLLILIISCSPSVEPEPELEPASEAVSEPEPVQEDIARLKILETFDYYFDTGTTKYYYVTALVQNTGNVVITYPEVDVTLHKGGVPVQWNDINVYPTRLAPGEKGAAVFQSGKLGEYDDGDFRIVPGGFFIEEEKPYLDIEYQGKTFERIQGYYRAAATFKNIGQERAPSYTVRFIFYTSKGQVVTTSVGHLLKDLKGLLPGESVEVRTIVSEPMEIDIISGFDAFVDFS